MNRSKLLAVSAAALTIMAMACGVKEEPPASGAGDVAAGAIPAGGNAAISGVITVAGNVPAAAQIRMNSDAVCVSLHSEPMYSEEIVVDGKNLANVFVYIKEGLENYSFSPPQELVTLNQQGCRYSPHVGGIMVNQDLRIVNSDPTLHNIQCVAEKNPQFNIGQAVQGMSTVKRFANPEVMVRFQCAVHKWMTAYFGILAHPYYGVTGRDGSYALGKLPPGTYVIEAWHERLGTQTQKVTVGDGEAKEINFTYKFS